MPQLQCRRRRADLELQLFATSSLVQIVSKASNVSEIIHSARAGNAATTMLAAVPCYVVIRGHAHGADYRARKAEKACWNADFTRCKSGSADARVLTMADSRNGSLEPRRGRSHAATGHRTLCCMYWQQRKNGRTYTESV